MKKVFDVVRAMETIAPTQYAADWDNVGLLTGDPSATVSKLLLAIDWTAPVCEEAREKQCEMAISYHPPIFSPLRRVVFGTPVYTALVRGVALFSPHTAWDVAGGGTNDVLADAAGIETRRALRQAPGEKKVKLVTFVPHASVESVSEAIFSAGGGEIGCYRSCSFRSGGEGTFFGGEGANPAVGEAGRLEMAAEVRVEILVRESKVSAAVSALRAAHPYEEPAFDLVLLQEPPGELGFGRVGDRAPVGIDELVVALKRALGVEHALVSDGAHRRVTRIAVCAGSGGDLLEDAFRAGAEAFVTGELRHHDVLRAASRGVTCICLRHSVSERASLRTLQERLEALLPEVTVIRSEADRDPLRVV